MNIPIISKQILGVIIQFPLGIIVAALIERICRSRLPYARLRNICVKAVAAHVLIIHLSIDTEYSLGYLFSSLRILLLVSGIMIGTALQPVGLTGGIATGKSTVSSLFTQQGQGDHETDFTIIDIDGIAHDILLPEKLGRESVYHRLVSEFGSEILQDNNDVTSCNPLIDRRKLGDIVFRDRLKRKKLNSITHPKIIKIMMQQILSEGLNFNNQKRRVVCADIPLLFEGGLPMRMLFGTVVVITCNSELQLERLQKRNTDLTIDQCRQRIASQIPVEEKARKAHFVIRNDGNMKDLKSEVSRVKKELADVVTGKQRGIELYWLILASWVFQSLLKQSSWKLKQ